MVNVKVLTTDGTMIVSFYAGSCSCGWDLFNPLTITMFGYSDSKVGDLNVIGIEILSTDGTMIMSLCTSVFTSSGNFFNPRAIRMPVLSSRYHIFVSLGDEERISEDSNIGRFLFLLAITSLSDDFFCRNRLGLRISSVSGANSSSGAFIASFIPNIGWIFIDK